MKLFVLFIFTFVVLGFSQASIRNNLNALSQHQTARMGGEYFRQASLTGQGIRIAVFDAGFPGVDTHPAFEHMRQNIVATYDFTRDSENVFRGHWHGTAVLSNIAGKMGDIPLGFAPDAEFLLAITEVRTEPEWEEEAWLRAVKWAYEHGAHIITSSVGYWRHRFFPENMDGQTSLVARAAQLAAEKGILVINAAGNEGNNPWRVIITPADVETVLTVGGIDPNTQLASRFSSFGPTADGRRKPNVVANSTTVVAMPRGRRLFSVADGTSFAAPLVAGFAAAVWQANPELTAAEIFTLIEQSSELYPYYDYAHGHGVPNARNLNRTLSDTPRTFEIVPDEEHIRIKISDNISPKLGTSNVFRLYYHLRAESGLLREYAVVEVFQREALVIPKSRLEGIKQISVHFLGYTQTHDIP